LFTPKDTLQAKPSEAMTPVHPLEEAVPKPKSAAKIYEQLHDLNQHSTAAIDILANFSREEIIPGVEGTYYHAMLEEARASISQSVAEHMNGHEISAAAKADRKRLKLERKLFGPAA
jgi:hypothetical protein